MNTLKKFFPILITVVMLLGMVAATPATAAAAVTGCTQWHVVEKGEYLSQIATEYNTTFQKLAEINELADPNLIFVGQILCVSEDGSATGGPPPLPNSGAGVRIFATSVKEDLSVTLQGKYLVANTAYTIRLSNYKANQPVDYLIGTVTTGNDGTFNRTYDLPDDLHDVSVIRVLITSSKGDTASNWFFNMTIEGNTGGIGSPALSFTIVSVKKGKSVKIQANNLLPNVTYQVYLGKNNSQGVDGIHVGSLHSSKGGTVIATFDIPGDLADRARIDILIENDPLEIVAYVTFENK